MVNEEVVKQTLLVMHHNKQNEVLKNVLDWSKEFNKEFYDLVNSDLDYSRKVFGLERDNAIKIRTIDVCVSEIRTYKMKTELRTNFVRSLEQQTGC